jgi:hypothetical protein
MTDPRVLVRLDMVIGLLGILAALLSVLVVATAPGLGIPAVLVLAAASAIGSYWYRQERLEAAR